MLKNSTMYIFFTFNFKKEYELKNKTNYGNFKKGIYRFNRRPQILINKINHELSKTIHITKNDKLVPGKTIVTNLLRIKNLTKNINFINKKVPIEPKNYTFFKTIIKICN
ncbi:hypothetical protein AMTRI_Chr02g262830 [Amborella trichopoda]